MLFSTSLIISLLLAVGGHSQSLLDVDRSTTPTQATRSRSRRASNLHHRSGGNRHQLSRALKWDYQGCYADGSDRALSVGTSSSSQTPEQCQSTCQGAGYKYAGLENGYECYCGNTIRNGGTKTNDADCNTSCSGDGSRKCGGPWRLSIYLSSGTPDAPVSMGCYADGGDRTFKGASFYKGDLTPAYCFDYCGKLGFAFVGLENGGECYCSKTTPLASRQVASNQCTQKCGGDKNSICGGPYRLSAWQLPACDSQVTTNCAAGSQPPSTTTAPPAATSSTAGQSLGCYSDNGQDRTLKGASFYKGDLTPKFCLDYCNQNGFSFVGLENGGECYCSKSAPPSGRKVSDGQCTQRCGGDQSSFCGGAYLLNIYQIGGTAPPASTTTTSQPPVSTAPVKDLPAGLNDIGCFGDAASMGFASAGSSTSMTPASCAQTCQSRGLPLAGIQNGNQCYCGNKADWATKSNACTSRCSGDSGYLCGAASRMSVYSTSTEVITGTAQPASGGRKWLWAHYMVGNTPNHTAAIWEDDVRLAAGAGIDGFALNMGQADWQVAQLDAAYQTAYNLRASVAFKLFLSFDMTAMFCQSENDARYLARLVLRFADNPYQAMYQNKVLVTTFAGDQCRFGRGSAVDGWNFFRSLLTAQNTPIYLMPSIFWDVHGSANNWYDGHFDWDSAWPLGPGNLDGSRDQQSISTLNSRGKGYMANISPAFFTYYGNSGQFAYNKNWIYRSDNWLLATRFETLMGMRGQLDMIELTSWNDYGESHHIGPIRAVQPGSERWVNGLPHTAWLDLIAYYAPAWKNGAYPSAPKDKIILWSRPHPKNGSPTNPTLPRPRDADWTEDKLYALVILGSSASVDITSGDSVVNYPNLPAGVTKISLASRPGAIGGKITRNGQTVTNWNSGGVFSWSTTFRDWNFNYFVQAF